MANHIHYKTTLFFGYRDPLKMYETVCKKSMCNKPGRLSQGWKNHAGTDKIEFIIHIEKPKDRSATYLRAVYDIKPQIT